MDELTRILLEWGLMGLIIASFTESFCSPILPDVVLIPLALAHPEHALYYGAVATIASVFGGFIGYGIGYKIGLPAARKIIPAKYEAKIQHFAEHDAVWALFIGALSPIPYKFVSITAGALKVKLPVFVAISAFGRAKRFLLEGLLLYYYGEQAVHMFTYHSDMLLIGSLALVAICLVVVYIFKRVKKNTVEERV
jgi:undecaprenyl-diphosphatase